MIANYNIIQGSEDWHKIRYSKIAGTLSKGLFVKSDTLLIDILSQKLEPFELEDEGWQSADMQRGNELEPIARKKLSEYIGVELLECGWLQSTEIDLLGISPDGISADETISAEIKCPNKKKHTSTILADDIPSDNIHQCLHYFTINEKLQQHYFCSYRPENELKPMFVKCLTRQSEINLGTKAKPVVKTVEEWVKLAKNEAVILAIEIKECINKLQF
jgi:hypothetical protein